MSIRIALLRHGHTAWNRMHRLQGSTDIPLDDEARETLSGLRFPSPWDRADLWSSPLSRAKETAQLLSRPPQVSAALTEMNWGDWEGLKGVDLKADPASGFIDLEHWGWDYRPPNGESPREVLARVEPWLNARTQDTVVVAHMGTLRAALALATGWDFHGPCPFVIKRNKLLVIEKTTDGWKMLPDPIRLEPKP